jgi:hypothetical protein
MGACNTSNCEICIKFREQRIRAGSLAGQAVMRSTWKGKKGGGRGGKTGDGRGGGQRPTEAENVQFLCN